MSFQIFSSSSQTTKRGDPTEDLISNLTTFKDQNDLSKTIKFSSMNADPDTQLELSSVVSQDRTIAFPDASGTLVIYDPFILIKSNTAATQLAANGFTDLAFNTILYSKGIIPEGPILVERDGVYLITCSINVGAHVNSTDTVYFSIVAAGIDRAKQSAVLSATRTTHITTSLLTHLMAGNEIGASFFNTSPNILTTVIETNISHQISIMRMD